ncbi:ethanolamine ammonia-lyase subunit EutC [Corynebacterium vitaeruminis]|uniref:Ethanolamine ammonia-lyase small subunit n=1 Tax=Corynebacterium vitaeruminis DSM 20294 TaxID=1224164 RepID=W5XZ62_9CORY|nr:ethanolamine ammonia-lyase subunit EutC [Corynebacterium vitaeruminis]AHI21930.1 ethanolamine ammonia-lyase small subunit [Corynebacterium vitaeruminis DSM 20294]
MSSLSPTEQLRSLTPARVGLGRTGAAIPTRARLEFLSAHASARDAVHTPLDSAALEEELRSLGVDKPVHVHSKAESRELYLMRPDLGRLPGTLPSLDECSGQVGVVLADGLSPIAVAEHGPRMYDAIRRALPSYDVATPVIAHQARVALGDHIGHAAGWDVTLVLIGERPGLSVPSSLGIYSTWRTRPGTTDESRNCVSNIHPPEGMGYAEAANLVAFYVDQYFAQGRSGFMIKAAEQTPAVR